MSTPGSPFSFSKNQRECPNCHSNNDWSIIQNGTRCNNCQYTHIPSTQNHIFQDIGEFQTINQIQGGMGEVFICKPKDEDTKSSIALKTFQNSLYFDRDSREAFEREIINWMTLSGTPYIMPAENLYKYDGRYLVQMPEIKPNSNGQKTLSDFLETGPLDKEKAAITAFEISTAMNLAQKEIPGFIHGDLKASNIFVVKNSILVSDFGISRTSTQQDINMTGTLEYSPPESWEGLPISIASDVYSFGIILYQIVTGEFPFFAHTKEQWKDTHLYKQPKKVLMDSDLKSKLLDISLQCMEKNPKQRPKDFESILQTIKEITKDTELSEKIKNICNLSKQESYQEEKLKQRKNLISVLVKLGKIPEALKQAETIPESQIDSSLLATTAEAYYLQGQYIDSLSYYKKAFDTKDRNDKPISEEKRYEYIIRAGLCFAKLKKFEQAKSLLEEHLGQVPEKIYPKFLINMAKISLLSGDSDSAISMLVQFTRRYDKIVEGHIILAFAYISQERFIDAEKELTHASAIDPLRGKVNLYKSRLYMHYFGNIKTATKTLEYAYGQGLESLELYIRLVLCYIFDDNLEEFHKILKKMMLSFPERPETILTVLAYYITAEPDLFENSTINNVDIIENLIKSLKKVNWDDDEIEKTFSLNISIDSEHLKIAKQIKNSLEKTNRTEETGLLENCIYHVTKLR